MRHQKQLTIAYVLWFFLGAIGAHRYYLSQNKTASTMLVLGLAVVLSHFYKPLLIVYVLWWLFDALLIPGYVDAAADHSMVQIVDVPKADKERAVALPGVKFADIQQLHDLNAKYMSSSERGDLQGAIKGATEALALCEDQLGTENGHAAAIRSHLGDFYSQIGNNPQAINMFKSAIVIQEKFPDQDISREKALASLYHSVNSLARIYASLNQTQDAKKLYRRIIDTLSSNASTYNATGAKKSGQYYASYTNALNNLAKLYSDNGQTEQAQPLFEEAISVLEYVPIENTALKVDIIKNHATNESTLQHNERAEAFFQLAIRTIEEYEVSLSTVPDTSEKAQPSTTLTADLDESNKDESITEVSDIVYENPFLCVVEDEQTRDAALQHNQIQMASCHNGLGIIYANQNRLADAEVQLVTAAKIRKQVISPSDPELLAGLSHLSLVYFKQHKLDKAEAVSKHILATRELAHGVDHVDTQRAKRNLELIQAEIIKRA